MCEDEAGSVPLVVFVFAFASFSISASLFVPCLCFQSSSVSPLSPAPSYLPCIIFATLFVSVDTTPHWLFSRGFCYASFACAVPPRNLIDSQMVSASLCSQRRATSCAQGRCHCGSRVEIWPLYTICTWGLAIARMPPRGVQQRFF